MKVYVIQKGCYSDRHIVGVVETEKEAKNVCDAIKDCEWDSDSLSYAEYDTKQFQDKRIRFTVWRESDNSWHCEYDDYDLYDNYVENTCDYEDHYVIYADTGNQAIKIAQDMYYEEQAKNEGLT